MLDALLDRVQSILAPLGVEYELIFDNDDSSDRSLERLLRRRERDLRIKIVNTSRRFGFYPCVMAGFRHASGDAVLYMATDLQDPPELIPDMLAKYRDGADVVNTVRTKRLGESAFKMWVTRQAYRVINLLTEIDLPENMGDFKLLSRRVLNELLKLQEVDPYLRGIRPVARVPENLLSRKYVLFIAVLTSTGESDILCLLRYPVVGPHGEQNPMRCAYGLSIVLAILVSGCAIKAPAPVTVKVPTRTIEYLAEVKPVLDKRCAGCHSCYNSPCQLQLDSFEGADRGATKRAIYNASRLNSMDPTRLFTDAQSTGEWRKKEFFSVTDSTVSDGQNDSLLIQMLSHKMQNPKSVGEYKPEADDLTWSERQGQRRQPGDNQIPWAAYKAAARAQRHTGHRSHEPFHRANASRGTGCPGRPGSTRISRTQDWD